MRITGRPLSAAFLLATCIACAYAVPAIARGHASAGTGIDLQVTLGTDLREGSCGTAASLDATQRDQVNFCYVVTNQSTTTLNYQSLSDDIVGSLLNAEPITLAPGASYQYNRIVTATASQAPTSSWTAYDVHPGYGYAENTPDADHVFSDGFEGVAAAQYDFVDITETGTNLGLSDEDAINVGIGFPFTFYGETSDQVVVSNNGGVLFGITAGFLPPGNIALPDTDLAAAILPYWTDLYPGMDGGNVFVQTDGEAPGRRFIVEWKNLPVLIGNQSDGVTFEAIFYEGSNRIVFLYADTSVGDPDRDDGITATIGLNAANGAMAMQYSYQQVSVATGKAILFSAADPVTYSSTQQVTLAVGAPVLSANPTQFDTTLAAGSSTTETLEIGNIGDRDLIWTLNEVQSRAHFPPVARFALPFGDPALSSGRPAPRRANAKAFTKSGLAVPLDRGVSAFAEELGAAALVSLDASNPTTLSQIGDPNDLLVTAGDFVDEDFSKLYVIDYYTYHLFTLDVRSGAATLIGTAELPSGGINWDGIKWDASTATLYGVASAPGRDGTMSFLYKIDPATAATTFVGQITGVGDPVNGVLLIDIAIDPSGLMYGVDVVTDTFVAIDKSSGAASTIGSIGFDANFAQGMDFDDYTGILYYAAYDNGTGQAEMYTIDLLSGAATLVAPISPDPTGVGLDAFAIARLSGVCAYPNDVPWLSFSVTDGVTSAGGASQLTVTFDASALEAGIYSADICVFSNDFTNRRAAVPVTLTVQ